MIYELKKDEFYKVNHLLNKPLINLEIKSVVEGYNPGWIFVDHEISPKTCMVWSKGIKGFYFLGASDNESFNKNIYNYIMEVIRPRAKALALDSFEFSGTSEAWDLSLRDIFKDFDLNISKQYVYEKDNITIKDDWQENLGDGFKLKKINRDLLMNGDYNTDYVKAAIYEWWESLDDFLNNGHGFCILSNHLAVCSCVTSFRSENTMESHIKTKETYRKKGLASLAVNAFLCECKKNKYQAYWDCMEENYGSRALAEKFGYEKQWEYYLYSFEFYK